MFTFDDSRKKENKRLSHCRYSTENYLEGLEDEEDNNEKINENKKLSKSNISNKADIDEIDSPGLNPNNESECCFVF